MRFASPLLFAALTLAACGGGSSSTSSSPFSGQWSCTLSVYDVLGTAQNSFSGPATLTVTEGPSSSLVVTDDSGLACRLTYTASDRSAIAQSGQSCTIGSAVVTVQDGSLQLNGSSLSASVHQSIEAGGPPAEDESLDYTCSRK